MHVWLHAFFFLRCFVQHHTLQRYISRENSLTPHAAKLRKEAWRASRLGARAQIISETDSSPRILEDAQATPPKVASVALDRPQGRHRPALRF
jgi:gamma-glutamyl:cysteine ligase YbdK (ATP-grasp superfamily)